MKILCISNYYPPFFDGGYEISVKETMDWLATKGHQIYILCGYMGVEKVSYDALKIDEGIPLRILRYIDYINASMRNKHEVEKFNYSITMQIMEFVKPDLVYFGNIKAISIAPVIAVQKTAIPRVFDIGDDWLKTYLGRGVKNSIKRWLKAALPWTIGGKIRLDPVIAISQWIGQEMASKYHSKDVSVIPRGIALPNRNERLLTDKLSFIYLGKIQPLKGLDLIIQASRRIVSQDQNFVVDVYGEADKSYLQYCQQLIKRLHLGDHFRFKGKIDHPMQILPRYDVLLMPTVSKEPLGRVIIEAMACSLIVIATNAYGPKEIISHKIDGYLFERGSVSALASAILELYNTDRKSLEQIRVNARLKVEQKYEINLVKNQVEKILERIVNQKE